MPIRRLDQELAALERAPLHAKPQHVAAAVAALRDVLQELGERIAELEERLGIVRALDQAPPP